MQEHPDFERRDLTAVRSGDDTDVLQPRPERDLELRSQPLGMTETCGPHCYEDMTRDLPEKLRGSFGRPLEGVDLRIVDPESGSPVPDGVEGEICVRGWSVMHGLYKKEREETFDRDGFYHTGDGGRFEHGHLFFTGRLGDMIKTGGANVAPREIEALLVECPEVMEAYVAGVPDPARGQIVAAAVILKPGQQLGADELEARLKAELSAFKLPRLIAFFDEGELHYTASGKIDKLKLVEVLTARATAGGA